MYRHAKRPPRNGFVHSEVAGGIDNGPSAAQREQKAAYDKRIEAERLRNRRQARRRPQASP
jgi:hypothetical protein